MQSIEMENNFIPMECRSGCVHMVSEKQILNVSNWNTIAWRLKKKSLSPAIDEKRVSQPPSCLQQSVQCFLGCNVQSLRTYPSRDILLAFLELLLCLGLV